jgi:hypothetical protein
MLFFAYIHKLLFYLVVYLFSYCEFICLSEIQF